MQDVIEHCDTTLNNVKTVESSLRNHIEENQFVEIKKAITANQDSCKRRCNKLKTKILRTEIQPQGHTCTITTNSI